MFPVQGIVAVAQAQHERAMEQLAAMHAQAIARHLGDSRDADGLLPFHDTAPHVVDIRTRKTLCGVPLSACQVCNRVIFPYRDDSHYDLLYPSLGCTKPCETCRACFDGEAYDEHFQALLDHQHLVALSDSGAETGDDNTAEIAAAPVVLRRSDLIREP